jgi:hypothetical protein
MSKSWIRILVPLAGAAAVAAAAQAQGGTVVIGSEARWPRQTVRDGNTLTTYQPQVDEWKDFKTLSWRMAFSIKPTGGREAVGAATMEGATDVDQENHIVRIHDIKIDKISFPSADPGTAAQMEKLARQSLPQTVEVSLERLAASTPKKDEAPTVALNSTPPRIFVSQRPAILLEVSGPPAPVAIPDTKLDVVTNTNWRLFRDNQDRHYYLLAGDQWLTAADLNGPWAATAKLPKDIEKVAKEPYFSDVRAAIPPRTAAGPVPTVFYSDSEADAIVFDGSPEFRPVAGTKLSYADNTNSYVFRDAADGQYYYLTAGRWFRAPNLQGPWSFASANLPADFAHIPPDSPASQVLASVPGTGEAKDALLMAQVPTTAVVNPQTAAANAQATYDGRPKFTPIAGTSMQYATNTGQKVIETGGMYYLCKSGVWFVSSNPTGPWQTATSVPPEIYTIPPSSPVYNVTYVTQQALPDGQIQASYTAGYMGAFAMGTALGAVLVNGTGYAYPPYVGGWAAGYPAYYGYPGTYGSNAYYNPSTGRYGVSQTAYGPYGSATRSASYNPYTGTAARSASVSTPWGKGAAGEAYNPYTGAYGATKQGSNAYSSWGSSAVSKNGQSAYSQHYSNAQGTTGSVQTSKGGEAVGAKGAGGNEGFAGKTASGNMYAGHDGNVYKNTGSGWEKYGSNGWSSAKPSSQGSAARSAEPGAMQSHGASPSETQNLQREAQDRARGEQTNQRFQQHSGGFGGARGGRRR